MFTNIQEIIGLVDRDDEASRERLRSETAAESIWKNIILERPDLKRVVTENKTLPDNVLRILAQDADPSVRSDVAMKRALPDDLFALLAEDPDETVRARIAWNAKTPDHLLQKLALDASPVVADPAIKRVK